MFGGKLNEKKSTPKSKKSPSWATHLERACKMFEKLPQEDKAQWIEVAKKEHKEALARWKEDCEGDCSTLPEDRQR